VAAAAPPVVPQGAAAAAVGGVGAGLPFPGQRRPVPVGRSGVVR
jgi:hypothetical protein